jgi:hypothetical protein
VTNLVGPYQPQQQQHLTYNITEMARAITIDKNKSSAVTFFQANSYLAKAPLLI